MSAPVQAQSISSLNNLFANPPQYPRNPTHEVHKSLVLYIVRVPGSQDVFLTPLKPPTKASVSIEAVQSSLYFLHVERPEDEELRKSLEATKITEVRDDDVSSIQRKPLPPTPHANYPASQRPAAPPKSYPHYQPALKGVENATQAGRFAARGTHLKLTPPDTTNATGMVRKPVGARSMPARSHFETSSAIKDWDSGDSPSPIEHAQGQFRLARKAVRSTSPADAQRPNNTDSRHRSPTRANLDYSGKDAAFNSPDTPPPGTLCITLIRRDPASGSQWNVGSISHPGTSSRDTPLRAVEIELTSPGYSKFARLEGGGGHSFHRRVAYMIAPSGEGSSMTGRRSSSNELPSGAGTPTSKKPRQAYAFISPWQGMCSFSNGLDGKSLRCRHVLSSANSSIPGVAADVAEIRFNLPWGILRSRDPNKQPCEVSEVSPQISAAHPPWRRSFQALTNKARIPLSHSDRGGDAPLPRLKSAEERRMSLDLGREKAGGGFKGHSAKLGKLIIDDEGLKMCDLVVAACMGVWWQHYAGDSWN
ncbi:uncharacterized protein Z518_10138 [Rhinocladiella mackenziei CBS 650.93]|uniref:Oxidoreductase-like protein n=1 Tax=Rhinocladiella mackenziei CBS 650.93 TaxID=1442369 RepID=A0A0D2FGG0_9EURO|nr:uncharacterized protein Z518_10138 [Rhinocladiella mackenziei CBS 650.93]KIX01072.1 hypothetical protein Z518_10138 [Rhinocladiella mackenziei CBS 650.93]